MTRFQRPCLDCGKLTRNPSRCDDCRRGRQRAIDQARDTPERRAKKRALYGGTYPARRKALLATATICHICNQPPRPGDPLEADHIYPGDPGSPLAPAHRSCNQARGNKPLT